MVILPVVVTTARLLDKPHTFGELADSEYARSVATVTWKGLGDFRQKQAVLVTSVTRVCRRADGGRAVEHAQGHLVVIRYEGPKGGPGGPEMLTPTSAIMSAGLGSDVALLTDGRFSGGSHGFIIGHITPEDQEGGPLALVRDGDRISIDAVARELRIEVSDAELASRRAAWRTPPPAATSGVLGKCVRLVKSASEGCVTD